MMEPISSLQAAQMLPKCHCQGCHTSCFHIRSSDAALIRQNSEINDKIAFTPLGACGWGTTI